MTTYHRGDIIADSENNLFYVEIDDGITLEVTELTKESMQPGAVNCTFEIDRDLIHLHDWSVYYTPQSSWFSKLKKYFSRS